MRKIVSLLITLLLGCTATPALAQLQLQPTLDATCKPAAPAFVTVLKWKESCPRTGCFTSRVTCTNGLTTEIHSSIHPGTTVLESAFYTWAPWSFLIYLLPLVLYAALALVGSELLPLCIVLNTAFLGYFLAAAWALYGSITENPWGAWAEQEHLLLLNPYVFGAALFAFLLANAGAVRRGVEYFFFQYPPEPAYAAIAMMAHPQHAAYAASSLQPNIYEFIEPEQAAAFYRQQTEHLKAAREKLDAETALAKSIIRNRRARDEFNGN